MLQKPLLIIPVRLASTRLPNKPLANICGKSMICHVWEKAMSADIGPVIVACGDQEIVDEVKSFGGIAILTDPCLPSGTDRIKVAADTYDPKEAFDCVINVQGDLPALDPILLSDVLEPLRNPAVDIGTLAAVIQDPHELTDENVVKIALSLDGNRTQGRALYFSRSLIPSGDGPHYHHIGLYAYRRSSLNQFVSLPVNSLEARERLEQLRALAHGMRIDVKVVRTQVPFGVDTLADLEKAIRVIGESYSL